MSEETKTEVDDHSGTETTGHEWDGIRELNTPLPRWWLIVFYVSIAWAVVYWIAMPSWPLINSYTEGLRGHSDRLNVVEELDQLKALRSENAKALSGASLETIEKDPQLQAFAYAAGASAFGDNCATCHGSGGQGLPGYPSLIDDDWLWGGTLDEIRKTLEVGIRTDHVETRMSMMPSFGADGLLSNKEISDMTQLVLSFSGRETDAQAADRARPVYGQQCASCHGANGLGDPKQGAPNLADAIWLYGGGEKDIRASIYNARAGVMPAWNSRLDTLTLDALAVYVHGLGGGE